MFNPRKTSGCAKEGHHLCVGAESSQKRQLSSHVDKTKSVGEEVTFFGKSDTLGGMRKNHLIAVALVALVVPVASSCASSSAEKDTIAIMSLTLSLIHI